MKPVLRFGIIISVLFVSIFFVLIYVEERSRCEEHKSKELHVDLWGYFYI